jgi:hypothetical protein
VLVRQTEWSCDEGRWNERKKVADVRNERNTELKEDQEHKRCEYKEDERIEKVKE